MLSIGNRPTLLNSDESVEVNIFDWDEDLYGKNIIVHVIRYIRAQEKYASLDDLKKQLAIDKQTALRLLH